MTWSSFRNSIFAAALVVGVLTVGMPSVKAQGGPPSPALMAKFKAWGKYNEQHKKLTTLGDQIGKISKLNEDASNGLDKAQSTKLLALLNPVKNKAELTDDEASALNKKIGNLLTVKQIKALTLIEAPSEKWKKARGAGGGRGGAGGGFDMSKFPDPPAHGYNPLNGDSFPMAMARPMVKQAMQQFFVGLEKRAKG